LVSIPKVFCQPLDPLVRSGCTRQCIQHCALCSVIVHGVHADEITGGIADIFKTARTHDEDLFRWLFTECRKQAEQTVKENIADSGSRDLTVDTTFFEGFAFVK